MVRAVARSGCEVREERLLRRASLLLADPGDRFLGNSLREMPLWVVVRRFDRRGVLEERRVPLARFATLEAVPIVEALARRPAIEWTGGAQLVIRCVVPLPEGRRTVVIAAED